MLVILPSFFQIRPFVTVLTKRVFHLFFIFKHSSVEMFSMPHTHRHNVLYKFNVCSDGPIEMLKHLFILYTLPLDIWLGDAAQMQLRRCSDAVVCGLTAVLGSQ